MISLWRGLADGVLPTRQVARLEGTWPQGLRGTLLRNGPALFRRGDTLKTHVLDGDGLAQAWHVSAQGIRYQAASIRTAKYQEEQKEGRFLYPGFVSNAAEYRPVFRPDDINTANTNLIRQGGSLYALWEAGSAHELHPETLATLGIKAWSPESAGSPFGAHPKRDRQGVLWNIGVAPGRLLIYRISRQGELQQVKCHPIRTSALVHDFAITDRYLLIWMAPLELLDSRLQAGASPWEAMHWNPRDCSRLVVIERSQLEIVHVLEARADLATHVANAWDDGDSVHLHDVRCSFAYLSQALGAVGAASTPDPERKASAVLCHVNLSTGRMTYEQAPGHVEFPQIDQRYSGRRHRLAFHLEIRAQDGAVPVGFNALQRTDLQSGCQSRWLAPHGVSLEEHMFVPRANESAEGCGWLIGTGFDADMQASFCSVFEAEGLADGPLAMAYLDGPVPPCLHGEFVAS